MGCYSMGEIIRPRRHLEAFAVVWTLTPRNKVLNSAEKLNINPDSVSVGGISAGGTISLVLQHLARDAGVPLKLCMAAVPGTDKSLMYDDPSESPYPSFTEFANGPVLPFARIRLFGGICFPRDQLPERLALVPEWWTCPIRAENFRGLCDTFIRTGAVDPLRDEAEAYGFKLVQAGNVKVTMKRYTGCPHMFMYWRPMPQKHEYDEDSIRALKDAHGVK